MRGASWPCTDSPTTIPAAPTDLHLRLWAHALPTEAPASATSGNRLTQETIPMNRNDQNSDGNSRNDTSPSTIRSDASSRDASSGKSSSAREPQQGTSVDNRSEQRGAQQGKSRPDGASQR
jgi:hypothetical protein